MHRQNILYTACYTFVYPVRGPSNDTNRAETLLVHCAVRTTTFRLNIQSILHGIDFYFQLQKNTHATNKTIGAAAVVDTAVTTAAVAAVQNITNEIHKKNKKFVKQNMKGQRSFPKIRNKNVPNKSN